MFLKQLEVIGFKSFATKVSVEFVPGVTAVVGPNGSGKSNITDAIKWVLGEQSAKTLRGTKMEDIIFAGSDAKKPLNMAEVTLTLDNNDHYLAYDFSEISITRRVYRSGDSEFLINGQTCRLKDIVELFMDSGLGREAYSIISQGKIDDILNSKAEDKRKIFEEAAGVLKYKTRKLTAEKKLNDSEDHLNRVEDILHELEDQVNPLQEQASIAKDFSQKKEQLEQVEVALLAHDIEETHSEWDKRTKAVKQLANQEKQWTDTLENRDGAYEGRRAALQALDESIEDIQEALMLASEMLEKFEGQKNVLHERQKHAKENTDELKKRIEMLEQKSHDGHSSLKAEIKRQKDEEKKGQLLQKELKEKTKQYEYLNQDLDQLIERLKSDYIDVLNEQASIRNEMRYLNEQKDQITRKSDRLLNVAVDTQKVIDDVQKRKQAFKKDLSSKTQRLNEQKNAFTKCQETINIEKESYAKQTEALNKVAQFIQQATSKKEMLEAMSEDYAGFFHGVKKVLKARGRGLDGIHGAVAELLNVKRSCETAIETALGSATQHIVVDAEQHARKAIQFLKQQQGGRATFLPMSVVKPKQMSSSDIGRLKTHEAFVGVAATLVQFEESYQNIVYHLLGHIIIAKDLKGANELAKKIGWRYRIVTLEGDVVSPGGAMTGGSQKQKSTSLLGRQREIDQLTTQLTEMNNKKWELESAHSKQKVTLGGNELRVEKLRDDIQKLSSEKQEFESSLREIVLEEKNAAERSLLFDREKTDFNDELKKISQRIFQLEKSAQENQTKETELSKDIEDLTKQKKHQEVSKDQLTSEVTELKINVAEQQQIMTHQREKTKQMKERLALLVVDLDTAKRSVNQLGDSLSSQVMDQDTLLDKINECRHDKNALTIWLKDRRMMRAGHQENLAQEDRDIKQEKRKLQALSEELRTEEIALGRLDVVLDNDLNALRLDYEISFELAKENYPLTMEENVARKQVKLIKKAIDELGAVNLGAIDEYERVSTRLNFLTEQREDLRHAKETLINVMNEMDAEVGKRFGETFYQVKEHFHDIFKALFGGGKADLCLTDPEDLLDSGVDILAQPPGKKLQHLSLLSGGERALTAIALLFAILKVRPVPFCVLDEVEAALDDANVDRYASYLKTFSKETQFIVVTHRKGTMENADVLYGVTMQESGVSKLVSVRLEEMKELVETG